MPVTRQRRDELLIGGVAVLAIGGVLLMRRASTAAPATPAAVIPADVLPVAGVGAGGGGGLGTSSGLALLGADVTSQLAGQAATAASDAAAGRLGNQASLTPGTGNQVPTGSDSPAVGPGPALPLGPVHMTAPQLTPTMQAAVDKVASYAGDISTVGPLYEGKQVYTGPQPATNLSLVDWYKYQYAKVAAAQGGVIIGESADFLAHSPDAAAYLADTLQGGAISMYGPNAGPEQKALDLAASTQAKRELGLL
jgi:hypothetical protein